MPKRNKKIAYSQYEQLLTHNFLLEQKIEDIHKFIRQKSHVFDQMDAIEAEENNDLHSKQLLSILKDVSNGIDAKVIFREPASWNRFIWINQGYQANNRYGKTIIAKNSPVVLGDKLIGVVEELYPNKSKVRLITDDQLNISVTSVQGDYKEKDLFLLIDELKQRINDETQLTQELIAFQSSMPVERGREIAMGEVCGGAEPIWKASHAYLKGIGFHPIENLYKHEEHLFQVGDLIITSGLDGLFPKGLKVGFIESILPLTEGAYYYEMRIKPSAYNINSIDMVTVIAPYQLEES